MSKEQINELAKDIYPMLRSDNLSRALASLLYDKGWRRQSEGEWGYDEGCDCFVCTVCEYSALNNYRGLSTMSKYCPNCGSKMKGADDEQKEAD